MRTPVTGFKPVVLSGLLVSILQGCSSKVPPCPFTGEPAYAPSAGCLVVKDQRVLLVESYSELFSPPGGKTLEGESAQCAAHRETWEETGLSYRPIQLLKEFDTGFFLYSCEPLSEGAGQLNGRKSEVKRALWLPVAEFDQVPWRYEGQGQQLLELLQ